MHILLCMNVMHLQIQMNSCIEKDNSIKYGGIVKRYISAD